MSNDTRGLRPNREQRWNIIQSMPERKPLVLISELSLAEDAGVPADGSGFAGFTIAHNVDSEAAVDEILEQAISAGAKLMKPAQKVFWGGYSGYFADPDGYLWEVAHNPLFWVGPKDEEGQPSHGADTRTSHC